MVLEGGNAIWCVSKGVRFRAPADFFESLVENACFGDLEPFFLIFFFGMLCEKRGTNFNFCECLAEFSRFGAPDLRFWCKSRRKCSF